MENASKALLIAGSVLLVIAIIAIALTVFLSGQRAATDAERQLDLVLIDKHNADFLEYDKDSLTYIEARNLVAKVISNNNSVEESIYYIGIEVELDGGHSLSFVKLEYKNGMKEIINDETINNGDIPFGSKFEPNILIGQNGLIENIVLKEIKRN